MKPFIIELANFNTADKVKLLISDNIIQLDTDKYSKVHMLWFVNTLAI